MIWRIKAAAKAAEFGFGRLRRGGEREPASVSMAAGWVAEGTSAVAGAVAVAVALPVVREGTAGGFAGEPGLAEDEKDTRGLEAGRVGDVVMVEVAARLSGVGREGEIGATGPLLDRVSRLGESELVLDGAVGWLSSTVFVVRFG